MGVRSLFRKSFTHKRYVRATDSAGGWTKTLSTIDSDLKGQISRISGSEDQVGVQAFTGFKWKFYCAASETLQVGDIIEYDGTQYRVLTLASPAHSALHQESLVLEIQNGS